MPEADRIETNIETNGFESLPSLPPKRSLGQSVHDQLKKAILKGDLEPGRRVVEARVASALGISRTPVREAIHKLEREGLLHQDPKGGFFVKGLTRADVEETFGIRSILESYAARLAAVRHLDGELAPLEEKMLAYERYLKNGDLRMLPEINTEFHDLLYGLSRSPRLIRMINDLRDPIYRFRRVILKIDGMARLSNEDHRRMLKAIEARDAVGVEQLVRDHILRGQDVVLKQFDMQKQIGV